MKTGGKSHVDRLGDIQILRCFFCKRSKRMAARRGATVGNRAALGIADGNAGNLFTGSGFQPVGITAHVNAGVHPGCSNPRNRSCRFFRQSKETYRQSTDTERESTVGKAAAPPVGDFLSYMLPKQHAGGSSYRLPGYPFAEIIQKTRLKICLRGGFQADFRQQSRQLCIADFFPFSGFCMCILHIPKSLGDHFFPRFRERH